MKYSIVVAAVLCLGAEPAIAQTITPQDARAQIGHTVTVEGVVAGAARPGGLVLLDIGAKYPDQALTAVIGAGDVGKFSDLNGIEGATVDLTGTVTDYKGHPEIVLKDPSQLVRR